MKVITLGQFIDSMEKNGYEQAFGKLMVDKKGELGITAKSQVSSACALGQAMLNLNVLTVKSERKFNKIFQDFVSRVADLNDNDRFTPSEIANIVRGEFESNLDARLEGYSFRETPKDIHSMR